MLSDDAGFDAAAVAATAAAAHHGLARSVRPVQSVVK